MSANEITFLPIERRPPTSFSHGAAGACAGISTIARAICHTISDCTPLGTLESSGISRIMCERMLDCLRDVALLVESVFCGAVRNRLHGGGRNGDGSRRILGRTRRSRRI